MDKEKSYSTLTYNALKASFYGLPVFILLIILVIVVSRYLNSDLFVVIGWISACSVPFLFQKRFKNLFTRRVELGFDDQAFSIKEYTLKDDTLVSELAINWANIKAYKFYFSATNVTYLVIYLKNRSSKSFSFKDEKNQEQAIKENSVFSIFFYFVKYYNSGKQPEEEIVFKPGFLTTKSGELVLYAVILLAIVAIILHVVLQPNTSMFSFMSLFIILGLVIKRKNDKALYKKIGELQPRS